MTIDEVVFHEQRGLGKWERWGHPLDTLTVLIPFVYIYGQEVTPQTIPVAIILAAFSCLFICKDEWVHRQESSGTENWLHAMLFIIHPIMFLGAYFLWIGQDQQTLSWQIVIIACFLLYQILRWNIPWKKIK